MPHGWKDPSVNRKKGRFLIKGLNLKPTDKVADIGAGSGYFSFRMAKLVPQGKVYADISPQMIGIVRSKMAQEKVSNEPVQSTIQQTKLTRTVSMLRRMHIMSFLIRLKWLNLSRTHLNLVVS